MYHSINIKLCVCRLVLCVEIIFLHLYNTLLIVRHSFVTTQFIRSLRYIITKFCCVSLSVCAVNKDEFEMDNLNVLSFEYVSVSNTFVSELCEE